MGRPKRLLQQTALSTISAPDTLSPTQVIARVLQASGHNLFTCDLPCQEALLVELPAKFRNAVWIRRGGYVVIDTQGYEAIEEGGKVKGEIVKVVAEMKEWRKKAYWPKEFGRGPVYEDEEDQREEEDTTVSRRSPSFQGEEEHPGLMKEDEMRGP